MEKMAFELSLDMLENVSGGVLPDGWQSGVDDFIRDFKNLPEERLVAYGLTRSADSAVLYVTRHMTNTCGMSSADADTVAAYIRSIW